MRAEMALLIAGMAAVTFLTRFVSFLVFRQTGVPASLEKWLGHVPTAILTALIVPSLLLPAGKLDISISNPYLLAGVVAAVTAFKTRHVLLTMGLGMAVMLALRLTAF